MTDRPLLATIYVEERGQQQNYSIVVHEDKSLPPRKVTSGEVYWRKAYYSDAAGVLLELEALQENGVAISKGWCGGMMEEVCKKMNIYILREF